MVDSTACTSASDCGGDGLTGQAVAALPEAPVGAPPQSGGLRVRVVDDNTDGAMTLAALLEALGHQAVTAFNGRDAVRLATEQPFDLVFLGLGLPDISGIQVALTIRGTPRGSPNTWSSRWRWPICCALPRVWRGGGTGRRRCSAAALSALRLPGQTRCLRAVCITRQPPSIPACQSFYRRTASTTPPGSFPGRRRRRCGS